MNRKSLAQEVAKKTKLTQRQAENLIIAFGAAISEELEKGNKVVYSNFGTFYTVHYPSKTIYHPKEGKKKTMIMLPTNAAKWMPSGNIKNIVNGGIEVDEPTRHKLSKNPIPALEQNQIENPNEIQNTEKPKLPADNNQLSAKNLDQIENLEEYQKAVQHKESTQSSSDNIYEEILSDGSKEFSTVKGSIKLHHDGEKKIETVPTTPKEDDNKEGVFARLKSKIRFGGPKEAVNKDEKVVNKSVPKLGAPSQGLAGEGVFGAQSFRDKPQHKSQGEEKIDKIKGELEKGAEVSKKEPTKAKEISSPKLNVKMAREPLNIVYKDLTKETIDKNLLAKVPEKMARKYKAVPLSEKNGVISVAMIDPQDIETKEMLKKKLGPNLEIVLSTESDIEHVLNQYQGLESEVSEVIENAEGEKIEEEEEEKKKKDKEVKAKDIADDAPASKIVDSLLKRAIRDQASDIHIEPTENDVEVRYRIDGVLRKKVALPKDIQAAVISRLKILSKLKIDEQRIPQDGRFNLTVDRRRVDFRVSTMPIAAGEKVVLRILDKESGILTIEQLGIEGEAKDSLEGNLKKSHGMILVTGPTGSGKSTTLYAMISKLYNVGINIITLEDPIEYQIKGINQSQVNSAIGYTFANGLRSILRQDPDIIMLGEIRDKETAEMAVHAALTGHVLLSTLHTNTAAGAAPRLIDMGVEPFLLTSSINAIIAQRLVRKICEDCREEYKPSAEELKNINDEIQKMPEKYKSELIQKAPKFYQGKGCKACDKSGTKGRIGIFEVLDVSDEVKSLIQKRSSDFEIEKLAISQGMVTILQDGIIKASKGLISMSEVWRSTRE